MLRRRFGTDTKREGDDNALGVVPRPIVLAATAPHPLTVFAFADCHSQDPRVVLQWLRAGPSKPDIVVFAGDGIERFRPRKGRNYLAAIAAKARFGLGVVLGNNDNPQAPRLISGRSVYDLHSRPIQLGRFLFLGLQGRPQARQPGHSHPLHRARHIHRIDCSPDFHVPESAARTQLDRWLPKDTPLQDGPIVVLCSHAPPWGMTDLAASGKHCGWTTLARTILGPTSDYPITLVISGHVHACGLTSEHHDLTTVVNVASHDGHDDPMRGALITLDTRADPMIEWVELVAQWPRWGKRTTPQVALEAYNLDRVAGLGGARIEALESAGITNVRDLSLARIGQLSELRGRMSIGTDELRTIQRRATALLHGRPMLLNALPLPPGPRIFIDIETSLRQMGYIYLIACLDERSGEELLFAADHGPTPEAREKRMLNAFGRFARRRSTAVWLSYSSSNLEHRSLSARFKAHGMPFPRGLVIHDIYAAIHASAVFPAYGQGLKAIAASVGYKFASKALDGYTAGVLGSSLNALGGTIPQDTRKYAMDDVRALRLVVRAIEKLIKREARDHA